MLNQVIKSKENPKKERLEARITAEQKELIERAAHIQGRSITDFIVASAQKAAHEIIKENEVMMLSTRDSIRLAEVLLDPPHPNESLKKAYKEYKKTVDSEF